MFISIKNKKYFIDSNTVGYSMDGQVADAEVQAIINETFIPHAWCNLSVPEISSNAITRPNYLLIGANRVFLYLDKGVYYKIGSGKIIKRDPDRSYSAFKITFDFDFFYDRTPLNLLAMALSVAPILTVSKNMPSSPSFFNISADGVIGDLYMLPEVNRTANELVILLADLLDFNQDEKYSSIVSGDRFWVGSHLHNIWFSLDGDRIVVSHETPVAESAAFAITNTLATGCLQRFMKDRSFDNCQENAFKTVIRTMFNEVRL